MSAAGQTTRRGFAARTLALGAAALLALAWRMLRRVFLRVPGEAAPAPAGEG